jgi:hypothetical protein
MALAKGRGGGTFVLNLAQDWESSGWSELQKIKKARDKQGWQVHRVADWDDLVAFARHFSRITYGEGE